ncbi:MAG TPA: dTDP-4-dehydrorhamnose reductase [Gemmataceae bacterium]|nr:dTDP-4-dehydrorhamnose reductase [Gemmataceae bacterium]
MKVLILGSKGQLGSDLVQTFSGEDVFARTHADLDVCDFGQTNRLIEEIMPDVVINTAAFHKVEECEEKPEKALQVNALAVRHLAQVCAARDTVLVHISTDYVFDGTQRHPYTEQDVPHPANMYGVSKLAGEYLVEHCCPRHFIVRSSGLYGFAGASGKGGNFPELMIRLAKEGKPIRVVADQVLTPTYTRDLAQKIKELVHTDAYGLYHVTSSGQCSWYEFAGQIFALLRWKPDFTPTTTAAFAAKVKRPAYSVLASGRLPQAGIAPLRTWWQALEAYLLEKGHLTGTHAQVA